MNPIRIRRCWTWVALFAVCCCVLGFYQTTDAAPKPTAKPPRAIGQPLADLVRLQTETVQELRAIRQLLEKQDRVLRQLQKGTAADVPGDQPFNQR